MAAVLCMFVGKTARRAFSTLSGRPLHASRSINCPPTLDASHVKQIPKPTEVDLLVKKIDDLATKEMLIGYTERLAQEQKSNFKSSHLQGLALPYYVAICTAGSILAGYRSGFHQVTEQGYQASSMEQI